MKKKYIIAIILIVIGLVICLITYPKTNFKYTYPFNNQETANLEYVTYELEDKFTNIEIDEDVSGIEIIRSNENKVVFHENPKHEHSITVKNGTLIIAYKKDLNFSLINPKDEYTISIYTTLEELGKLDIDTEFGYVKIYDGLNFNEVDIETTTGSIYLDGNKIDDMDLETSTGNIEIINLITRETSLKSSTGNINIDTLSTEKEIEVETTTGNIKFNNLESSKISMVTTTGNIIGTINGKMKYDVKSKSGLVDVPQSEGTAKFYLKSISGNIQINTN